MGSRVIVGTEPPGRRGRLEFLDRWPPKHNLIHLPRCHSHTTCHDTGQEALIRRHSLGG